MPFAIGAALLAFSTRLDPVLSEKLASVYLISRVLFNGLYLAQSNDLLATLRSVDWMVGAGTLLFWCYESITNVQLP